MKKFLNILIVSFLFIFSACITKPPVVDKPPKDGIYYKAEGNYIKIWHEGKYKDAFFNTVNIGIALPGKYPGETDIPKEYYTRWFQKISDIGFDSIRIYTLHRPQFYEALYDFNLNNKNPIYVFHGIWLDYNHESSLFDYSENFEQEIREVIDAVHGNVQINERLGKAWGKYETDISRWVVGWLLGREVEPEEVRDTNNLSNETEYNGDFFKIEDVNSTTVWIVKKFDYTLNYEKENYNQERPISFSSWPTLDPLEHPSEKDNKEETGEDQQQLELYKIKRTGSKTGFFASYHAYPYYPDFMNNDLKYQDYSDDYGKNPYLGYLKDLKSKYKNIPLYIAEYGVPSSWGNAHFSDSGMHHGGLDEKMQGIYSARMLKNIFDSGCMGGAFFALFDEWWKICWINDHITKRENYHLWHDMTNPEQNYGLITFDAGIIKKEMIFEGSEETNFVDRIYAQIDYQYFTLDIKLKDNINSEFFYIAFDMYGDDKGETTILTPNTPENEAITIDKKSQLLVEVDLHDYFAQLYVAKDYDLFGIWHIINGNYEIPEGLREDLWNEVKWKNNNAYTTKDGREIEETIHEIGKLKVRESYEEPSNLDALVKSWRNVVFRLPWTLLQFADPSNLEVVYFNDNNYYYEKSSGISLTMIIIDEEGNEIIETEKISWKEWDVKDVLNFVEKDKQTTSYFKRNTSSIPFILF